EHRGEGGVVRVVVGRAADQDVVVVAAAEYVGAGSADENVAPATARERVRPVAAEQHVFGAAAPGVERVVAATAVQDRVHGDVGGFPPHLHALQLHRVGPGLGEDENLCGRPENALSHAVDRD